MLIDTLVDEHIPPTKGFYLHIAHLGDATNVEAFKVSAAGDENLYFMPGI